MHPDLLQLGCRDQPLLDCVSLAPFPPAEGATGGILTQSHAAGNKQPVSS